MIFLKNKIIFLIIWTLFLSSCTGRKPPLIITGNELPKSAILGKKYKLALVLGAGGARGIAHIGVLEELEKHNIKPDLIVGSSIGAIIGAMYADGQSANQIKEKILKMKRADLVHLGVYLQWGNSKVVCLVML